MNELFIDNLTNNQDKILASSKAFKDVNKQFQAHKNSFEL